MIDIVVLATADWDHPLWTNKQHVAVSLVDEGCRVLYIESLGLRTAQATGRDLKRIVQRLWRGLRPPPPRTTESLGVLTFGDTWSDKWIWALVESFKSFSKSRIVHGFNWLSSALVMDLQSFDNNFS